MPEEWMDVLELERKKARRCGFETTRDYSEWEKMEKVRESGRALRSPPNHFRDEDNWCEILGKRCTRSDVGYYTTFQDGDCRTCVFAMASVIDVMTRKRNAIDID